MAQCLKWRTPVNTIAMPFSSAAAMDSASRIEPPGWITARMPAAAAVSMPSRNGKNASDAITLPATSSPASSALALDDDPSRRPTRTSTPDLRAPAANIALDLQLPQDRWVLWTWGPSMGPAVLYWSQLVVLLLAAWLLARHAPTPLRFHHWLLLGLGFSAFAWSAYALVVAWLIAMGLRARGMRPAGVLAFNLAQVALAVLTALALLTLVGAVPQGLLGLPDMHVAGNGSGAWNLRWFADQSAGALPRAGVFSVSLWVYKLAMLAWALWLANALIGWLRWAFGAWSEGGYWRRPVPAATPPGLPSTRSGDGASHD